MRRFVFVLLVGAMGTAILISLGVWQIKRLAWKETMLTQIEAQITANPRALFPGPWEEFEAVWAEGVITADEIHVLTSRKGRGPGYRVIAAFEVEGRRVLLDRGFILEAEKSAKRGPTEARIEGNFRTVQESDNFTPSPDAENNIYFARDVSLMAKALQAEPVLIILRATTEKNTPVDPWPVNTSGIPNDHLQYAVTWFSLALIWLGMTGYYVVRQRRKQ